MAYLHYILAATALMAGVTHGATSNESIDQEQAPATEVIASQESQSNTRERLKEKYEHLKEATKTRLDQLNVDATATQPVEQKDPFQAVNRKIYQFNDVVDRYTLRPLAVQAKEKIPSDVRSSYAAFRQNLGEPWNAVNQIAQGKPTTALKSLGRFTINTLTSLGFADPARRLGLLTEKESFGTTLGYYGVPSGPYIVLPFWGSSTLRDSVGLAVESQTRLQRHLFEDDKVYWTDNVGQIVNTRANLLDLEKLLQGDKYAAMRDAYLQRSRFVIAEKRGETIVDESESLEFEDDIDFDDVPEDLETSD